MSYILDALKRAEQQRGDQARAIRAPRAFPTEGASRRWPWLVGGAGGMAVVVMAIALWPRTVSPPPARPSAPVDVPAIAARTVPAEVVTPPEPATPRPLPRPAVSPAAPPTAKPRPPAPARVVIAPAAEPPAPPPSEPEPLAPATDVEAMAAKISLQVLSWAPEPKDRFVFLNGRRYGEGQKIDGFLVERILEDGVVLSLEGERVTLKGR